MKKIHPNTRKAISRYAAILLKYYRQMKIKGYGMGRNARFHASLKANVEVSGNVYCEIANRQMGRYRWDRK